MKSSNLRLGNIVLCDRGIGRVSAISHDSIDFEYRTEKGNFVTVHDCSIEDVAAILLTEDIMKTARRREREDYAPLEFRVISPGERQLENQYWSNWIDTNTCDHRLHLSPSYSFGKERDIRKANNAPEFWYCWYHGAGEWFLPIQGIRQLKYVHQLQNLFYTLSGKELEIDL